MSQASCIKYKNAAQNNNYSGGILTYVYRWKITNWSDVRPFMEHTSQPFSADGLQWSVAFINIFLVMLLEVRTKTCIHYMFNICIELTNAPHYKQNNNLEQGI